MSIISVGFILFAIGLLIVYYLVPKKAQRGSQEGSETKEGGVK